MCINLILATINAGTHYMNCSNFEMTHVYSSINATTQLMISWTGVHFCLKHVHIECLISMNITKLIIILYSMILINNKLFNEIPF